MKNRYIIGTRGSLLAITQTELIINNLKQFYPEIIFEIKIIKTLGDKMPDKPLQEIKEDDIFTRELDKALLNGEIDVAVHSLKDVPFILPFGLCIAAIPKREDPRDVLVSRDNLKLNELPKEAVIGTSSERRATQLKKIRPDLKFEPIRGNIDERLKKVEQGLYDATILAAAGLNRLGLHNKIAEYFETKDFPHAAGQGALAVMTRQNDEKLKNMVKVINHDKDAKNALMERILQAETGK